MKPREWIRLTIPPRIMIITGLLTIPSFLFQDNLILKAVQTVLFVLLSVLEGKRFKPLPPLVMVVSIAVINLFNPIGRIIFTLGRFRVTYGALYLGLIKGLTLVGLIYLSRSAVRSDLVLPGRFGRIIGRTFYYFDRINERWSRTKGEKRGLIRRLDILLLDIDTPEMFPGPGDSPSGAPPETTGNAEPAVDAPRRERPPPAGYAAAAGFLLVNWGLFALGFLPGLSGGLG